MIRCIILSIYIVLLLLCIMPYITFADFKQQHYVEANKYAIEIKCLDGGGGSGVIINKHILTAFHVIQNTKCKAIHNDNTYELELIKYDIADDLALLKPLDTFKHKGVELSKKTHLKPYTSIITIGFPLHFKNWLSQGIFMYNEDHLSFSNMTVFGGNSGGGVFIIENNKIKLVGIIHSNFYYQNQILEDYSTFINIKTIRDFLNGK